MISWRSVALLAVIALLGFGIYNLHGQRKALDAEVADLRAKFEKLQHKKDTTASDIEYFNNPENRLKEVKKQQNLVNSGEKLIIVVPETKTATTTASSKATSTQ
ncbi:MAG: septum formation initiator family protein [Candidatus Jorgensenbacteria bacterium]|nr:septum formation initiator family protein [Candidatus Jorgensenbacteria bacterium]